MRPIAWLCAPWLVVKGVARLKTQRGPWSVRDLDAAGDGFSDDTLASQCAVAVARTQPAKHDYVPPGEYLALEDREPTDSRAAGDSTALATVRRRDVRQQLDARPARSIWGGLPFLTLVAGGTLLVVAAANALSRSGHRGGDVLFWLAILSLFALATFQLTSRALRRRQRLGVVLVVAAALYLVKVLQNPFMFMYSDEFVHAYNARQTIETGALLTENPILPVTPQYTGLPSVTSAVASVTGLGIFEAGVIVVGAARLVMMAALFFLFEQVTRSVRVAGLAALLYAANPNFVFFTAQYAYESLALPLAVLVMACTVRWMGAEDGLVRRGAAAAAATVTLAVVMTHHMTTYALLAFLVATSLTHALVARRGDLANPWRFALFTAVALAAWLTFVASETAGYIEVIFTTALESAIDTISAEAAPRELFVSSEGLETPVVERVAALGSIVLIALALPFALHEVWRRYRRHPVAVVLAVAAVGYLGTLSLRLVPRAWEVGNRSSEFLFIGVAFMLALVAVRLSDRTRSRAGRALLGAAATVVFAGGVVSGSPYDLRLAQPYRVTADGRVIEPPGTAAARWAARNVAGSRFGADESNARLLLSQGQVALAGSSPDIGNVLLYPTLAPDMVEVLTSNRVEYVVVDRRRVRDEKMAGYFFTSRRGERLGIFPPTWYAKWDRQPGVSKVFDAGDVAIYDVAGLRYDADSP